MWNRRTVRSNGLATRLDATQLQRLQSEFIVKENRGIKLRTVFSLNTRLQPLTPKVTQLASTSAQGKPVFSRNTTRLQPLTPKVTQLAPPTGGEGVGGTTGAASFLAAGSLTLLQDVGGTAEGASAVPPVPSEGGSASGTAKLGKSGRASPKKAGRVVSNNYESSSADEECGRESSNLVVEYPVTRESNLVLEYPVTRNQEYGFLTPRITAEQERRDRNGSIRTTVLQSECSRVDPAQHHI